MEVGSSSSHKSEVDEGLEGGGSGLKRLAEIIAIKGPKTFSCTAFLEDFNVAMSLESWSLLESLCAGDSEGSVKVKTKVQYEIVERSSSFPDEVGDEDGVVKSGFSCTKRS